MTTEQRQIIDLTHDLDAITAERNILQGRLDDLSAAILEQAPSAAETRQDRLGLVLEELLAVNRQMLSALQQIAERGGSSVEIDSNGKAGETKTKVKVYDGSPAPVADAVEAYGEAIREVQRHQMDGWAQTVQDIQQARTR